MTSTSHLVSFVTNQDGKMVTIHVDLPGVQLLIRELALLREAIKENDCPHTHMLSAEVAGEELSSTKLEDQPAEVNNVCHVKIYGWNSEWAVHHIAWDTKLTISNRFASSGATAVQVSTSDVSTKQKSANDARCCETSPHHEFHRSPFKFFATIVKRQNDHAAPRSVDFSNVGSSNNDR